MQNLILNPDELNKLILALFILNVALGLGQLIEPFWRARRLLASINVVIIGVLCGFIVAAGTPVWAVLFIILQIYRLAVSLRIIERRINAHRLRQITLRSEALLLVYSSLMVLLITSAIEANVSSIWAILGLMQFAITMIFLSHVRHMKKLMKAVPSKHQLSDDELPTLSVAIPARNETIELANCIESLLENDYPKLEILVLDDCSQDSTSDIIKSFAHRGVRFIKGTPPPEYWIAKNYAYEQLFQNASGDYLLFCGTDVRVDRHFLRNIATYLVKKKLTMISILPRRDDTSALGYLLQPMRYWRELVWPKSLHKTPPALSTCWLVSYDFLNKKGGFRGLRQHIRPEWPIASENMPNYRLVASSDYLNLLSVKSLGAQWNTAVRTRYPELHRRPESVAYSTLWQLFVFIGPIAGFIASIAQADAVLLLISIVTLAGLLYIHSTVYKMVNKKMSWRPLLLYPYNVILEIVTINYSMFSYEFGGVTWRGRNICMPVLDIQPRLPDIK